MNIYVGNLSYEVGDSQLEELFSRFGAVSTAKIITDRDTGRSKGFGFVEMANADEAEEAIAKLNGTDFGGRTIVVNKARPKSPTGGPGGGGGGGGPRRGPGGGHGGGGGHRGGGGGDRGRPRW